MNEWKAHLHLQDRECHCSSQRKGGGAGGWCRVPICTDSVHSVSYTLYTTHECIAIDYWYCLNYCALTCPCGVVEDTVLL